MTLEDAIDSITHYATDGRRLGSFLHAVVANDLCEAIDRADATSLANLPAIVRHLYTSVPMGRWGSYASVAAWLDLKDRERKAQR